MTTDIRTAVETVIERFNAITAAYFDRCGYTFAPDTYGCEFSPRAKYWRVYHDSSNGQRFVEFFVNKENGDVYYPGGWAKPEPKRVARFNISTPEGIDHMCFHKEQTQHGWLYLDTIAAVNERWEQYVESLV